MKKFQLSFLFFIGLFFLFPSENKLAANEVSPDFLPSDKQIFVFQKKVIIIDHRDQLVFNGKVKEMTTMMILLYRESDYLTTIDGVDYHCFSN